MSVYRFVNPIMNSLLSSPAHGVFSKRIMSVSYEGVKSGSRYTTPVSYYRDGDTVFCFTNGSWRHNFKKPHYAKILIRGHNHNSIGNWFDGDQEQLTNLMFEYFKAVPQDQKFYGVKRNAEGEPRMSYVRRATSLVSAIQFDLQMP